MIKELALKNVGPIPDYRFDFAPRINVLTLNRSQRDVSVCFVYYGNMSPELEKNACGR